jgi:hypothetical protein
MLLVGIIFSTLAMNSVCTVEHNGVTKALHVGGIVGGERVVAITKSTCVTDKRTMSLKKNILAAKLPHKVSDFLSGSTLQSTAECYSAALEPDLPHDVLIELLSSENFGCRAGAAENSSLDSSVILDMIESGSIDLYVAFGAAGNLNASYELLEQLSFFGGETGKRAELTLKAMKEGNE